MSTCGRYAVMWPDDEALDVQCTLEPHPFFVPHWDADMDTMWIQDGYGETEWLT